MGILNVTPDSFSDGGKHVDAAAAADAGFAMGTAGAAIIDVGGESTRPGAPLIWEGDEISRTEGVVAALAEGGVAVSIHSSIAGVTEWRWEERRGGGACVSNGRTSESRAHYKNNINHK